jgi:hypothetical protein
LGCNTHVHGSSARNLSVQLFLSQTSKNTVFLIIAYVFSSTKLKNRVAQVLPGSEVSGEETEGTVGRNGPNNVCTNE